MVPQYLRAFPGREPAGPEVEELTAYSLAHSRKDNDHE